MPISSATEVIPKLLHSMGAMGFNGLFRHPEFTANLFIQQPRCHELHNLELARR